MKRKEDDLAKIDGKYVPIWLRIIIFIISFLVAFFLFRYLSGLIMG